MLITITDDVDTMGSRKLGKKSLQHPILSQSYSAPIGSHGSSKNHSSIPESSAVDGSLSSRIRILHLRRPPNNKSYGFHLRGGREHGTGFFISHVEPGSEAYAQGLRTGDQVVRVNHLNVSRALHKEVASLVQAGTEVVLEVKSAGLVPVKNNASDPLSWVLVENGGDTSDPSNPSSLDYQPDFSKLNPGSNRSHSNYGSPVQIILGGAGKYTIGCSICKGPAEKPGIFVQRVRERGMAESAGLRPGDQILSCNGIPFYSIEFQQAVHAMKASSCLRLEVLRGAGLELVMGESSGYNSSASSETGEEAYPSSETDSREVYPHPLLATSLSKKLSSMRERVQLDSNRDWKEIEAEWAEAEVSEKRHQLETNTHSTLSRQSYSGGMSKSFLNLTINEEEQDTSRLSFPRESSCCSHYHASNCSSRPSSTLKRPVLRNNRSNLSKPRSMIDLRDDRSDSQYKIAMQTATDAHVSKIVIPSPPKNELNALKRLDELSSGSKSSTLLSSKCDNTNHAKMCSISSTSSEEYSNQNHFSGHARNLTSTLKEPRPLHRCRSTPQDLVSSEDSDSLLSSPSSSVCISGESGRFKSTVIIRNNPPAPPPRDDATKLTRQQQRKMRRNQPKALPSGTQWCHSHSPPDSPCNSSSGCSSRGPSTHLLRHKSLGSLSASSDDSNSWEDRGDVLNRRAPPRVTIQTPAPVAPAVGGNIPPPPPPPPPLPGLPSLQAQIVSRQQEITGAANKLKPLSERTVERKIAPDPKKMQHEQLMEEFKKAHARMLAKRQTGGPQDEDTTNTEL